MATKTTITTEVMAARMDPMAATILYGPWTLLDIHQHAPTSTRLEHVKNTGTSHEPKKSQNHRACSTKPKTTPFATEAASPTTAEISRR